MGVSEVLLYPYRYLENIMVNSKFLVCSTVFVYFAEWHDWLVKTWDHRISLHVVYFAEHPALAVNVIDSCVTRQDTGVRKPTDVKSLIDSIYNGFLLAVPKSRRSREKRAIRRFGWTKVQTWMTPKRNLVECLDCGEWHEGHAVCGWS